MSTEFIWALKAVSVDLEGRETGGEIKEAVRLAQGSFSDLVELKRTDESTTVLRIAWRMLPRNGGRALFLLCPHGDTPRRQVYGWEWDSSSGWSNRVRQSIGGAGLVAACATLPKAAICVQQVSGDLRVLA
jgi:hypothetical protein